MVDVGLGGFHDRQSVRSERKLIRFPNLTEGRLADAINLLTAPGTERELRSEAQFRRFYRSASLSWPQPRQHRSRISVLVGVASVASVFATATGLSAASVLPPSASHALNTVLGPLNADGGSPTTPPPSATQPAGSAGSGTAPNGTSTSVVAGSAVAAGANAAGTSACRHGKGPCTVHHTHSVHAGQATVGTTGGANVAVHSNRGSAQTPAGGQTSGGSSSSSTGPATGTGSGSGIGSNRGGNLGGQGGSTPGSGSSRGGNAGGGSGSKSGRSGGGHSGRHSSTGGSVGSGGSGVGKGTGSRGHRHSGSSTVTTLPPPTLTTSAPNDGA